MRRDFPDAISTQFLFSGEAFSAVNSQIHCMVLKSSEDSRGEDEMVNQRGKVGKWACLVPDALRIPQLHDAAQTPGV